MVHTEVIKPITLNVSSWALLPLIIITLPIISAACVALATKYKKWLELNIIMIGTCVLNFVLVLSLYKPVIQGMVINGTFYKGIDLTVPAIMGFQLRFGADSVGLVFALITSFIWILTATFGSSYMVHRHAKGRFFTFYMAGLASCLGIYLVRDFFSLFVFFEFVTLSCYGLVAHDETDEAVKAGKLFLYISVVGGLVMLFGTILLYCYTGSIALYAGAEIGGHGAHSLPGLILTPSIRLFIFFLFMLGFCIKAGTWLVHIWLPVAHPVAPPPAHAVLSGLVVKVGIYGIIRTIFRLYPALHLTHAVGISKVGIGVIWLGVLTMFFGMVPALLTTHFKRLFAFSTVSQMGFIVFGVGCAMVLGSEGAMGVAGALYYVINHAVYKSAFFLCIGLTCSRTGQDYLENMGGMRHTMPVTALTFLFAVLSIVGIPFTAGFASKTMVHHSIVEAIEHFSHAHVPGLGWLVWAERMFMISAAGTFCYTTRSFYLAYMGPQEPQYQDVEPATMTMKCAFIPMIVAIVLVGLFPNFLLEKLIGPALAGFGFDTGSHAYTIIYNVSSGRSALPLLYDPLHFSIASFFSHEVVHNFMGVFKVFLITLVWYALGIYGKMFSIRVPEYLNMKNWYVVGSRVIVFIFAQMCAGLEFILDIVISFLMYKAWMTQSEALEETEIIT
ncbi:MAG: complex I subunit 5 family protein [bacterium]